MNKKYIIFSGFIVLIALFFVWQISGKTAPSPSHKLRITSSFYPLAFLANEIGGNKVFATNLTPAGSEPHEYEPTSRDMAEMERSSVLILNGLGLEPWYENAKKNIDPQKTEILVAGESLDLGPVKDPHVWLSPLLMEKMAEKVKISFAKADPKNENYYLENLLILKSKLETLDADYRRGLADCEQSSIVTSHAAFGYLASEYNLRQISIAGLSPDAEPSPKDMGNIVVFAKAYGVKYIFFESLASPKLSQTIADEIGAKTLVLNPLEGLTEQERQKGKNYLSIMRDNLANLQTALSCKK